jgi:hypothetical protein
MHRPAPVDVDTPARPPRGAGPERHGGEAPGVLAAGDHDAARDSLRVLRELVEERELSPQAASSTRRALDDLGTPRSTPYWRAPDLDGSSRSPRPVANIVLALVLFTGLYMTSVGKATTTVDQISGEARPRIRGPAARRQDPLDRRRHRQPRTSSLISARKAAR